MLFTIECNGHQGGYAPFCTQYCAQCDAANKLDCDAAQAGPVDCVGAGGAKCYWDICMRWVDKMMLYVEGILAWGWLCHQSGSGVRGGGGALFVYALLEKSGSPCRRLVYKYSPSTVRYDFGILRLSLRTMIPDSFQHLALHTLILILPAPKYQHASSSI